jgi:hypothetical protein
LHKNAWVLDQCWMTWLEFQLGNNFAWRCWNHRNAWVLARGGMTWAQDSTWDIALRGTVLNG